MAKTKIEWARLKALPAERPLPNGKNFFIENEDGSLSLYSVTSDGQPKFIRGIDAAEKTKIGRLNNSNLDKLDGLKTQSELNSQIALASGSVIPVTGTVLPKGASIPSWVTTNGKADLKGKVGGTTYTQAGGTPTTVSEGYVRTAYYNKSTDTWTFDTDETPLPETDVSYLLEKGGFDGTAEDISDYTGIPISFLEKEDVIADINTPPTISGTNQTIIINKLITGVVSNLKIWSPTAGNINIGSYKKEGLNAVRTKVVTLAVVEGVNNIDFQPNVGEYLGYSYNTITSLGRVGTKADDATYSTYTFSVNVNTGTPLPSPLTSKRVAVSFDVIKEGSISARLNTLEAGNGASDEHNISLNIIDKTYIQHTKVGALRNDNATMIRNEDKTLLCAWGTFIDGTGDHDQSQIKTKKSYDNGVNWYDFSSIPVTGIGNYTPSFYRKNNGDILMCYLVKTSSSPIAGYIAYRVSTDNGKTWGIENQIISSLSTTYYVLSAQRLFKDSNGVLWLPYAELVSGGGSSNTSTYTGKIFKSVDDGVTWVDSGASFNEGADTIMVEGGVYEGLSNTLYFYARSRSNNTIRYSKSIDGGVTWSPVQDLLSAPNSQSSIKKLDNFNIWVCFCNGVVSSGTGNTSRRTLLMYTSTNGEIFTLKSTLYNFDNVQYVFEPTIFEDLYTNGLYVMYTLTNTTNYDLLLERISYDSIRL